MRVMKLSPTLRRLRVRLQRFFFQDREGVEEFKKSHTVIYEKKYTEEASRRGRPRSPHIHRPRFLKRGGLWALQEGAGSARELATFEPLRKAERRSLQSCESFFTSMQVCRLHSHRITTQVVSPLRNASKREDAQAVGCAEPLAVPVAMLMLTISAPGSTGCCRF